MTAVTGLVALVGALSVTLMVAPRVTQERSLVDRVALVQWGGFTTVINAIVAGAAIGVATTQLASSDRAGGIVMLLMASSASAIAAISVQRRYDRYHGGMGAAEMAELRSIASELRSRHSRAVFHSGRRRSDETGDILRVVLSMGGVYAVCMSGVMLKIALDGGWNVASTSEWLQLLLVAAIVWIISISCIYPWYYGLYRWTRARLESRRSAWLRWWAVPLGPIIWSLIYGTGSESASDAVLVLAVTVVPATIGGFFFVAFAMSGRGPWAGVPRSVLRAVRRELRVASNRHDDLERIVVPIA